MDPWMLLLAVPAAWLGYSFYKGHRSQADLQRMADAIAEGGTLVDVRTPGEFASGHHKLARNIPLGELRSAKEEMDPHMPVVLYCRSGSRSAQALRILRSAGFAQVMDLGPYRNTLKLPEVRRASRKQTVSTPMTRNQRKRRRRRARG